ncbi:MAG: hypothetical protein ACKVYV_16610 [Limisphaerales bacterium]
MKTSPLTRLAFAASAVAACLLPAHGQVSVSGGVMTVSVGPVSLNSKFIVGPAIGAVQLFQVPGAGDGQTFTGIRAIRVFSGAGTDQLDFEITQAANFEVFADTGPSDAQVQVKWIIPATTATLNPKLTLNTGAGQKKIQVDLESFAANVDFDWTFNAGAGNAEVKGQVEFKEGSRNATADLALNLSSAADKVELIVDSLADNLRLDVIGRGTDSINTKVLADDRGTNLDVLFDVTGDAGGNMYAFEMASAVPNVWLDFLVGGAPAPDEIKLAMVQLVPGNIRSSLNGNLGLVADKVELLYDGVPSALRLTGTLDAGGGNDEIKLNSGFNTTSSLQIRGGDGNDLVNAEIKGSLNSIGTAPLRLLGGNNDDILMIKAEGGSLGSPSVVDGGPGFDIGSGPGLVINCEIIN